MADWWDDPELYKAPKASKSSSDWMDDPSLYVPQGTLKLDSDTWYNDPVTGKLVKAPADNYAAEADALEAAAAALPAPATPLGNLAPTEVRFGGVSYAPDGTPDYSAALGKSEGGLGQSLLRGFVGRGPDIVANMLELPATANEALIRASVAKRCRCSPRPWL